MEQAWKLSLGMGMILGSLFMFHSTVLCYPKLFLCFCRRTLLYGVNGKYVYTPYVVIVALIDYESIFYLGCCLLQLHMLFEECILFRLLFVATPYVFYLCTYLSRQWGTDTFYTTNGHV
ncbi:hypothetical protein Hanom_Chr05g00437451 [Helianthus anomalus]